MRKFILLLLGLSTHVLTYSQSHWTEVDRKYLLDNLIRSREELIKETSGLTEKQWRFKESPNRWSINEVVEHIAIWELLLDHEVSRGLSLGPQPDILASAQPDSVYVGFILETKPHISVEYTKPFTYTLPMGLNEGKNNAAWFLKMRDESISYIKTAKEDLRVHCLKNGRPNTHQVYIYIFGHTDRHLRQIRKIKQHPGYPR